MTKDERLNEMTVGYNEIIYFETFKKSVYI